ncbi:Gryzun, putative trafficking through golgi-domain-containing protein [Astrocystis sublimbata]|nr:Gryzun, putative trafficking through golgi-domain-containing protein [Astrocystis sublimbata]
MDAYPPGTLDHNVPFLIVSGLGTTPAKGLPLDKELRERGILVRSELPPIDTREARVILRLIQEADASNRPWRPRDGAKRHSFRITPIGREFLLPPRKARIPDDLDVPSSALVLHSPFSPLSPGSTLYPDGLIDHRWLHKHQDLLPSLCLCFYSLTSDPTLATLHDNQLKTDINSVKNAISLSGYKTRLAVVILSDQSPTTVSQFQERLELIRRSTALDPKASLFVLPTRRTEAELETAVDNVLASIFDQALEYYRELGRHVRKKRGRGVAPQPTIPPTSGTSHTLSLQGWNIRYDFKSAVFAEFRQESDVALRSYEQTYESLLSTDVLETIPAWDPRFNDARLLADMLAIRVLKCLLLNGQSTAAVRRWQMHNNRICDIVDRKGRGTQNYGWKAWQATWCTVMANLIDKVDYPELEPSLASLFRQPEKNLSAERLQPWELLHHSGYWYRAAAHHLLDRRKFAHQIPEEDRKPFDKKVQARFSRNAYTYDTYLCPEPHEEYPLEGPGINHAQLIFEHLVLARTEFHKRNQKRVSAELGLDACRELEKMGNWQQLLKLLAPLWRDMSFRSEGWWDITESMSWTLRKAAFECGQKELIIAIDWELMNRCFSKRPGWHYDITRSLDGTQMAQPVVVNLDDGHLTSFIEADFVFKYEEGKAGQTCPAQLTLVSKALQGASPITLKSLDVHVEGGLREIHINHEKPANEQRTGAATVITKVVLKEAELGEIDSNADESDETLEERTSVILDGAQDLTLLPGQTRVFELDIPLREPGDAKATSVQLFLESGDFSLKYSMRPGRASSLSSQWHSKSSAKRSFMRSDPRSIRILPRPPKMEIRAPKLLDQYYANESIQVELHILNEEDSDAVTKIDINLRGKGAPSYQVQVAGGGSQSAPTGGDDRSLHAVPMKTINTSKSGKACVTLEPIEEPTVLDLSIRVSYHLTTDPSTPIIQEASFRLNIVSPFEASYDFLPRIHSEWPSVFDTENIQDPSNDDTAATRPRGQAQKWALVTRYAAFTHEEVMVSDLAVDVLATQGNVTCTVTKSEELPIKGLVLSPKTIEEGLFDLISQKSSLDDRSPATADLALIIKWRRISAPDTVINITTLPLPRFYVTVSEPRVLASASYSSSPPSSPSPSAAQSSSQLLFLDITIENPSSHFLTFGLTMEPSDEFAFSGAKTTTLNVLPVARRAITYRLLPLVRGTWIRPTLVVRDKYFQKVLKIIATEGIKSDRDGILLWVPPPEEGEGDEGGIENMIESDGAMNN